MIHVEGLVRATRRLAGQIRFFFRLRDEKPSWRRIKPGEDLL